MCVYVSVQVLPAGASKGKGVQTLLDHLAVKPERVLAMGDGENDKVMLKVRQLYERRTPQLHPCKVWNQLWKAIAFVHVRVPGHELKLYSMCRTTASSCYIQLSWCSVCAFAYAITSAWL